MGLWIISIGKIFLDFLPGSIQGTNRSVMEWITAGVGPTFTTLGMGRDSFRTPAQKTVDVALSKQFIVHERFRAETRVEALNAFNSKNFITVNNTYGEGSTPVASFLTPLAGVTNTDPSRQLQFAVGFLFYCWRHAVKIAVMTLRSDSCSHIGIGDRV
jgi:hypothetical protein